MSGRHTLTRISHAGTHHIIEESYVDDRGVVVITSARMVGVGLTQREADAPDGDNAETAQPAGDDKETKKSAGGVPKINPLRDPRRQHETDPRHQRPTGPQERRPQ